MLNNVALIGRMVKDIELRSTGQGTSVCSFTLAVGRDFKGQNGEEQTDFINCVAWQKTAEFISKYFKKGNLICIKGSIQTRSWKDNDGNNRYATEVVVDRGYFVESKKDNTNSDSLSDNSPFVTPSDVLDYTGDDDLPF